MIQIGKFNKLKVKRKADFGYFLDGQTNNSKDDILLHNKFLEDKNIKIGEELEVFVYTNSYDKLSATFKNPLASVGDIAFLKVVDNTDIGAFIDIGLEKDILVPFKEITYHLYRDDKYLFYIYLDKSNRLAATTDIDQHLTTDHNYKVGEVISGIVYGFQTNRTAMVCVDNKYSAIILKNEYYMDLKEGNYLENLKIIKIYDDGKLGLTSRQVRKVELDVLEERIISYLEGSDGFMRFNDKSDPKDISILFKSSKKNFKRALGVLMKKGLIKQNEDGTYLL